MLAFLSEEKVGWGEDVGHVFFFLCLFFLFGSEDDDGGFLF